MKRNYVDVFLIPMKKSNLNLYKKMAKLGHLVWKEHGALDYYECVSDDIDIPHGKNFKETYKLKSDEILIFAYITYPNKASRNRINKKAMNDSRFKKDIKMPFDLKRYSVGGFKKIVGS